MCRRLVLLMLLAATPLEVRALDSPYMEALKRHRKLVSASDKIYGGDKAGPQQCPWQAAILVSAITETDLGAFFCGGTIISERWILTSAHCLVHSGNTYVEPDMIEVLSGTLRLEKKNSRSRIPVELVVPHKNYRSDGHDNDIALIKVRQPLSGLRVRLADSGPSPDTCVRVSGWGQTNEEFRSSPDLLYVDIPVALDKDCQDSYEDAITPKMFCAGKQGKDSCWRDSGGPAVVIADDARLVGIVSWGTPECSGQRGLGVYTRVASFLDWIGKTTTPGP